PPLLLGAVGQADPLVDLPRLAPASAQPVGLPVEARDLLHGLLGKWHQPTEPSISSWMSRLSSTAYSSGSSLVKGSMKPLTIIVSASLSVMPRDIRQKSCSSLTLLTVASWPRVTFSASTSL